MEERSVKRALRNNTNCVPIENIFKNKAYVMNSAAQCVPPEILNKLRKFQTLTCEDIEGLSLQNNESHINTIDRMHEVIRIQKSVIRKEKINFQGSSELKAGCYDAESVSKKNYPHPGKREFQEGGQFQPRMIKSEEHENECFVSDQNRMEVEERFADRYQKSEKFGQEILYNQFFRNDLENLFLD